MGRRGRLTALDGDVFVGSGIGESREQTEPGLADPRPDAVDERQLPDWRGDGALVNQLLRLVEDSLPLFVIELDRLLPEEFVDVGVAAIGVSTILDRERREAGGGVAEGAGAALDD